MWIDVAQGKGYHPSQMGTSHKKLFDPMVQRFLYVTHCLTSFYYASPYAYLVLGVERKKTQSSFHSTVISFIYT